MSENYLKLPGRSIIIAPNTGRCICLKCTVRPLYFYIFHHTREDTRGIPIWMEYHNNDSVSGWCKECGIICEELGEETLKFMREKAGIDHETVRIEEKKRTDAIEEERKCICKKHKRVCVPIDDELKNDEKDMTEEEFEKFLLLKEKADKGKEDGEEKQAMYKWLLWATDYDNRERYFFNCAYNKELKNGRKFGDPLDRKSITALIMYGRVHYQGTHCDHHLPRPYTSCSCNFSHPHCYSLMWRTEEMMTGKYDD